MSLALLGPRGRTGSNGFQRSRLQLPPDWEEKTLLNQESSIQADLAASGRGEVSIPGSIQAGAGDGLPVGAAEGMMTVQVWVRLEAP